MQPRILGGWIEPRTIAIAAYLITRMLLPRPDAERHSIMSEIAEPELVRETALDELGEWMSEHPEGLLLAVSASAAYPHALRAGTRTLRRVRVARSRNNTCCLLRLRWPACDQLNNCTSSTTRMRSLANVCSTRTLD